MREHAVQQGDCVNSIAFANGFTWQTLWNFGDNADLKAKRKDPNLLFPGDTLRIPELRPRTESRAIDQCHKFRRRGVPAKLRIRLLEEEKPADQKKQQQSAGNDPSSYVDPDFAPAAKKDKPRANVPFALELDGEIKKGSSDESGFIDLPVSPGVQTGRLVLYPGTPQEEVYPLQLGSMDPADEVAGVKKRLHNLGFEAGEGDQITPELEAAVTLFQEKNGLTVTGQLDEETKGALTKAHGG